MDVREEAALLAEMPAWPVVGRRGYYGQATEAGECSR